MSEAHAYWQSADEDAVMQEEHVFMWRAMLATIDIDLTGRRVLDAGCNRGGFLRLLASEAGIAAGSGFDPAPAAVADARRLAGEYPLTFEVADTVPAGWEGFEVAFSHEVLYLLHDVGAHAHAMHRSLAPGAVYYAVTGVHAGSPRMADWHERNAEELGMPPLYTLDDFARAFTDAGFTVAAARLKMGFVPVSGHTPNLAAGLEYFYEHKVMLRFEKPALGAVV
ncbi:MAG TPA: methyltransferase domain-containing protein [Solirubrobacteraceae bacterium]|nr:methyltransferase domain-containing protein [Solirubrobacteraceae bacterium]